MFFFVFVLKSLLRVILGACGRPNSGLQKAVPFGCPNPVAVLPYMAKGMLPM